MDHDHALRIAAVEKFLLNELPQDERDQFEEHFFDCQECASDLRAGAAFLGQAKKQFRSRALSQHTESVPAKKRRPASLNFLWRPAVVVPALAILLLAVGYQDVVTLPRLERKAAGQEMPQILPTVSLVGANSRGELPSVDAGGQPFLLLFDIPGEAPGANRFSHYTCSLYSPSGTLLFRTSVSAEQARNTISLRVPRLDRGDGVYSLTIEGDSSMRNQIDVARYPFRLSQHG